MYIANLINPEDGLTLASVTADSLDDIEREINHYYFQYEQEEESLVIQILKEVSYAIMKDQGKYK